DIAASAREAVLPAVRAIGEAWERSGDDVLAVVDRLAASIGGGLANAVKLFSASVSGTLDIVGALTGALESLSGPVGSVTDRIDALVERTGAMAPGLRAAIDALTPGPPSLDVLTESLDGATQGFEGLGDGIDRFTARARAIRQVSDEVRKGLLQMGSEEAARRADDLTDAFYRAARAAPAYSAEVRELARAEAEASAKATGLQAVLDAVDAGNLSLQSIEARQRLTDLGVSLDAIQAKDGTVSLAGIRAELTALTGEAMRASGALRQLQSDRIFGATRDQGFYRVPEFGPRSTPDPVVTTPTVRPIPVASGATARRAAETATSAERIAAALKSALASAERLSGVTLSPLASAQEEVEAYRAALESTAALTGKEFSEATFDRYRRGLRKAQDDLREAFNVSSALASLDAVAGSLGSVRAGVDGIAAPARAAFSTLAQAAEAARRGLATDGQARELEGALGAVDKAAASARATLDRLKNGGFFDRITRSADGFIAKLRLAQEAAADLGRGITDALAQNIGGLFDPSLARDAELAGFDAERDREYLAEAFRAGEISAREYELALEAVEARLAAIRGTVPSIGNVFKSVGQSIVQ
ncbi:MAG: hypothetical protein ACPG5O_13720, partial [Pseudoalteromonas tetraodonis]